MTDSGNLANDKQTTKDDDYARRTPQQLYDAGIQALRASGFILVRNPLSEEFMFHDVYVISQPEKVEGITYPNTFRVLLPLTETEDLSELQHIIMGRGSSDEEFFGFWQYLLNPDPSKRKPPYGYVKQLMIADEKRRQKNTAQPVDLGISIDCEVGTLTPKSWIPKREWFSESLYEIDLDQIFTLWPHAEQELLALVFGRILCGRSNNIHVNKERALVHTARMAACIIGIDPGLGKSTIFNYIKDALSRVGYTQATFRSLTDRFNLAQSVMCHWLYKDDVSPETFKKFLTTEYAKVIVTGGLLRVEQKGVNAVDVYPNAGLIVNSNSYDPRVIYNLDSGSADRMKFLATLSNLELKQLELPGLSANTPDPRPFAHVQYLANAANVSVDALMLWAMRLCADRFMELMNEPNDYSVNHLEERVRYLSNQTKIEMSKDTTGQILLWFIFCMATRKAYQRFRIPTERCPRPDLLKVNIGAMFEASSEISQNASLMRIFAAELKADWEAHEYPTKHPYPGMIALSHGSLSTAATRYSRASSLTLANSSHEIFKESFKAIQLKNGFTFPGDPVYLIQQWNHVYPAVDRLYDLGNEIASRHTQPFEDFWNSHV
ncbi:putative DNA primase [Acaryochloris phage A-HIS1]|nr:putative DNA primase [Acaryochloris phage A-HIS1]